MHISKIYNGNRRKALKKLFFELMLIGEEGLETVATADVFISNLQALSDKNKEAVVGHLYEFLDHTRILWMEEFGTEMGEWKIR